MSKKIILSLVISVILIIFVFINGCSGCKNGMIHFKSFNSSTNPINQTSWARLIDTSGRDWYNSVFFDSNHFYIGGWQGDNNNKKLAFIKLDQDGNLVYSKYYKSDSYSNIGIVSLSFYDNNNLLVSGWFDFDNGFIGLLDKDSGNISIRKVFSDLGALSIVSDSSHIYIGSLDGFVAKINKNNFNVINSIKVNNYRFEMVMIQPILNTSYVCLQDYSYDTTLIFDNNLNFVRGYDVNIYAPTLIDENSLLYLMDRVSGNLVISKINITDGSVIDSKSYGSVVNRVSSTNFISDSNGNTTHIIVGVNIGGSGVDVEFLKIDKNTLDVIWSTIIGTSGDEQTALSTIFPTLDGGIFAARFINSGQYGYAVKLDANGNLSNGCLFHRGTRNTVASNINYTPTLITQPTITIQSLTEISPPTLTEENTQTNVLDLCISDANGGGYFNTNFNSYSNGNRNIERSNPKGEQDYETLGPESVR